MLVTYDEVFNGDNVRILSAKFNGKCHYTIFLDKLSKDERNKLQKKFDAIFRLFDKTKGHISNTEKVRTLKSFTCNGCKEFKIKEVRISFIQRDNDVVLLDVFKKKQKKWSKISIQKTQKLCNQVQENIEKGGLL